MARRLLVALALCIGCGDDTQPTVDAAIPDAAPSTAIGDPCTRPQDPQCNMGTDDTIAQGTCSAGQRCVAESCSGLWPGGYCSQKCGTDNPSNPNCPGGSTCVDIGNTGPVFRCLKNCTTHADCRLPATGYVCSPTRMGNVCEGGAVCESAPAQLPRGDWSPNLLVPGATISQFESEGNVTSDGLGHVAVSQIGLYATPMGTHSQGSIMSVAVYDETGNAFHTPVAYGEYPTTMYTSDPVVAYDAEIAGTPKPLYLVWVNIDASMSLHTLVAKSIDDGVTFGPPNDLASAAVNTSGQDVSGADSVYDKPWIAASNGTVYVTYSAAGGAHENMVVSEDGGVTWTTGRAVDTVSGFHNFGQIAIATQTGDVYTTFLGTSGIVAARWRRSAGAQWFEPEVSIPGSANVANPSGNAVARDGTTFWAVWDDGTAAGSNIKAAVAANADAAAALSFAPPVTVNDDTRCGDHIHGTVAVDGSGIAHVLWLDNRYSGDLVQGVAHYAKSTNVGGTAFTTPIVVSDALFPFTTSRVPGLWLGDYIGITTTGTKVWATWADGRNGTPQRTHFFLASRPLP